MCTGGLRKPCTRLALLVSKSASGTDDVHIGFAETLPKAESSDDVYFMRFILHDWDDDACIAILRALRQAIGDSGASLIIIDVIPRGAICDCSLSESLSRVSGPPLFEVHAFLWRVSDHKRCNHDVLLLAGFCLKYFFAAVCLPLLLQHACLSGVVGAS